MRKQIDGSTKYETVCQIEAGKISIRHAAEQLGVHPSSVQAWVRLYETEGISGFAKQKNQVYSEALKVKAVEAYLSGKGSLAAICKEYKIRARIQLQDWIKVYTDELTMALPIRYLCGIALQCSHNHRPQKRFSILPPHKQFCSYISNFLKRSQLCKQVGK